MDLLDKSKTSYFEEKISQVTMTNTTIKNKEFEKCTFERCSFIECIFETCRFLECTFIECVLSAIKPVNSSFTETICIDSKVIGFDWAKAKNIRSLDFRKCQLDYSNFSFLKLPRLKLKECIIHEADFTEADVSEGDFEGTDFERTVFSHTNLTKCNFVKAFNYTIDFHTNILKKAKFSLPEAASLLKSLDIILES